MSSFLTKHTNPLWLIVAVAGGLVMVMIGMKAITHNWAMTADGWGLLAALIVIAAVVGLKGNYMLAKYQQDKDVSPKSVQLYRYIRTTVLLLILGLAAYRILFR